MKTLAEFEQKKKEAYNLLRDAVTWNEEDGTEWVSCDKHFRGLAILENLTPPTKVELPLLSLNFLRLINNKLNFTIDIHNVEEVLLAYQAVMNEEIGK